MEDKKPLNNVKHLRFKRRFIPKHRSTSAHNNNVDVDTDTDEIVISASRRTSSMINQPKNWSELSSFINNRCRYWVENRISQLLMSDNFTTRNGYTFGIDDDRAKAGLCFRFTKNGNTIAKIDSDGYLYCANVFANGVNLLNIAKYINDINAGSSLFVKHSELKDGTYVMDIDDLTANSITTDELTVDGNIIDAANIAYKNKTNVFTQPQSFTKDVSAITISDLWTVGFYDLEDMIIDFKKHYQQYNDRGRLIYTTSGVYNNTLSLDVNKSHSIICRVYSDGGGNPNTDYFTTIKHVITLLDGDGKTTLKDLVADTLTVNNNVIDAAQIAYLNRDNTFLNNQGFARSLTVAGDVFMISNMNVDEEKKFYIGINQGADYSGCISFMNHYPDYMKLCITGNSGLKISAAGVECEIPLTCDDDVNITGDLTVGNSTIDAPNIAYTNVQNTFTDRQFIEGAGNEMLVVRNSANAPNHVDISIGHSISNSGLIKYEYATTATDSYMRLYAGNNEVLQLKRDSVDSLKTMNITGDINMTGQCLSITSSLNAVHSAPLKMFDSSLDSGKGLFIDMGVNENNYNKAHVGFRYISSGNTSNRIEMQVSGGNGGFQVFNDSIDVNSGTSLGNALKRVILKAMYPVGSVYMNNTDARNPNDIFGVNVGTWYRITGHYLYSEGTDSLIGTEGNNYHTHSLNANGHGCYGGHGAGYFNYWEVGTETFGATYRGNCSMGGVSVADSYGIALGGHTGDNTSVGYPMYHRVACWYRAA